MTIKDLLRKQIIVSIDNKNKIKFITSSSDHVVNLNRALKNIKLDDIADYVHIEQNSITIIRLLHLQTYKWLKIMLRMSRMSTLKTLKSSTSLNQNPIWK